MKKSSVVADNYGADVIALGQFILAFEAALATGMPETDLKDALKYRDEGWVAVAKRAAQVHNLENK